ncbi:MAG: zinc ribbon domain-containing protein [Promethearchaeota archaeon]
MSRICPNCGQSVKDSAKFCKYCGSKLGAPVSTPVSRPVTSGRAAPAAISDRAPVTEVPAEVLAQLEIRSQLLEIEEEDSELLEEVERLEKELEQGDRSIAELESEIKPLQKQIKSLKKNEKKLKSKIKEFDFEKAGKERLRLKERAEKLEELKESGKVRESVYLRLKDEYEQGITEADTQYQEKVVLAREWLSLLKAQYKAIRDELSLLDARYSVGEVKDADYKSRKETLEKRSKILGHQVEIFETVLRDF